MASNSKYKYTFKKLTGSANYKQWSQDIFFALEEAKLWDHVLGMAISLLVLQSKPDNSGKQAERVYQQFLKVKEFSNDVS